MWQRAAIADKNYHETSIIDDIDGYKQPRYMKHHEIFIGHTTTNMYEIKPHYKEYKDKNQPKNCVYPRNSRRVS